MANKEELLSHITMGEAKMVFVQGVPATVRDELLNFNGAFSIADAVQIDSDFVFDMRISGALSDEARIILDDAQARHESALIFQFI